MNLEDLSAETGNETEVDQTSNDVVDEAQSPSATEGAESSPAADQVDAEEKSSDDAFREKFIAEYDGGGEPEAEETAEDEPKPDAEDKSAEPEHSKDAEDDEARISDEEFKKLPESVRQRIGSLSTKLGKKDVELANVTSERDTFKTSHEQLEVVRKFSAENNLTPDGINTAMSVAAMFANGDYEGFMKAAGPMITQARQALGQEYAPDLQDQIDEGHMTEEAAMRLTQANLERDKAKADAKALADRQAEQTQVTGQQQLVATMRTAMNDAESKIKLADPDYALVQKAVMDGVVAMIKEYGAPRTPSEAARWVRTAYSEVDKPAKRPAPKPTPTTPSATSIPKATHTSTDPQQRWLDKMDDYEPPRK